MPTTVNIERHKLNQAMYQKLKRYIMSKRKRELEERAQDDQYKKLKREREERKRQAELDAENLETTKGELLAIRKKIKELTDRRNDLFQRWKQLGSEESSLKEKQRSETLALLASMPATQFGIPQPGIGNSPRTRSHTPAHIQTSHISHAQSAKHFATAGPSSQHSLQSHYVQSPAQRDLPSPNHAIFPNAVLNKGAMPPSSALNCSPSPSPTTAISTSHASALAAVAAALAAQHRSTGPADSVFSTSAAAAAYFNAIVSLTSAPASLSTLSNNLLGMLNPASPTFAEALTALAASGLYSLPAASHGGTVSAAAVNFGHFGPPVTAAAETNFGRDNHFGCLTATSGSSKGFSNAQRHPSNVELNLPAADSVQSISGNLTLPNQISQKQSHHLGSLNMGNPLLSLIPEALALDTTGGNVGTGSSLPPAPVSYRGSITTGQSAQQIQLQQQQQAHQKQQQLLLSRLSATPEFASAHGSSMQSETLTGNHTALLSGAARSVLNTGRLSDAAALMASLGGTSPSAASALFNAGLLQAGFSSSTGTTATSTTTSSPSRASLAEMNNLNYLTTATLAAALQQQQQLQKLNTNSTNVGSTAVSPRLRASPNSSNTPGIGTSSLNSSNVRHFF